MSDTIDDLQRAATHITPFKIPDVTDRDLVCIIVDVSPGIARWFRKNCPFPYQRDLIEENTERLAIEALRGRLIPGMQIYFGVDVRDNLAYILNGNHTLEALIRADVTIPLCLTFKRISGLDQAGRIYARFDLHRLRNWAARLKAIGVNEILKGSDWNKGYATAIGFILHSFKQPDHRQPENLEIKFSPDVKADAMVALQPYAELYVGAIEEGAKQNKRVLRLSGVMAVGIELFRHSPSAAHEFFAIMARDDRLPSNDPRKNLLIWLREHKARDTKQRLDQSKATALAWNAFYNRKELRTFRINYSEFWLAGTPWKLHERVYDPIAEYLPYLLRE